MSAAATAALIAQLWPPGALAGDRRVFAVVDAAQDDQIYPGLLAADCRWSSLYRGDAAVRLAEVAPYLVELHPASSYTTWLLSRVWGSHWAIFMTAAVSAEILRAHFRRFLLAQLPDGKTVYFRFYDPRVLAAYLPSCLPGELRNIFGPMECYLAEGDDRETAVVFRLDEGEKLIATTIPREVAVSGLMCIAEGEHDAGDP